MSSSGDNFFRFLVALFAFIVVIIATYYVSKWTAGYQKARLSTRNFEVVDTMRIATNKYLMIIRVGRDKYFSVGVGKDEMIMMGEHSKEELFLFDQDAEAKSDREKMTFSGLLSAFGHASEKSGHHED